MVDLPNILFFACDYNETEIVKECVRNGYDINKQHFFFQTPLFYASINNNLDVVKVLVENGADLNIIDWNGLTVLGHAEDKSKVQQYLIKKGAKCLYENTEVMSNLKIEIENKSPVSTTTKEIINKIDSWGFSPFMWTIWHQSEEHFENYLNLGADVNQKCRNGTTPLMMACLHNNFKISEKLIEKGALVNDIDQYGNSPLIYCTRWSSKIADLLISKGAEINNNEINRPTPLIAAATSRNLSALEYFLNKKANVNAIDNTGNTAVAYASYLGRINHVKMLIENKADLDLCGPKGKTPLSWAATRNNLEMVKFLLTNGAKLNQTDYHNYTALSYAIQYNRFKIIKYLREAQETTSTPFSSAIQQNNFELVKSLVEKGEDLCKVDSTGNTPLMTAIRVRNQEIVEYLLENGAEITIHSALPIAIEIDDLETLKILIKKGAIVNKYYVSVQQTPLTQAVNLNNEKIVRFLVENGADLNLTGNLLRTAIKHKCNFNIVKFLVEKGADINADCQNHPSLLKLAIEQKNLRLIVLLVNHGANLKNDIRALEQFSKENEDFQVFLQEEIVSRLNEQELVSETSPKRFKKS